MSANTVLLGDITTKFEFEDNYERDQLNYFLSVAPRMERFMDIGANRGLYSYIANLTLKNGYIALVEAKQILAEYLLVEIERWPKENCNKIEVFALAVSDKEETLPFYENELDTVGTLSEKSEETKSHQTVIVN